MRDVTIQLESNGTTSEGKLTIIIPTRAQRIGKAMGLGFLMLLVTALSALIPMVHFIAVPMFLLITIGVVISCLRSSEIIEQGSGACPACKAPFRILKRRFRLPFSDVCEGCGRQVNVRADKLEHRL